MKKFLFLILAIIIHINPSFAQTPKKVLIFPFEIYAQQDLTFLKKALPEMLTSRLYAPDKIQIIELDKIEGELRKYAQIDKRVAEEIGKSVGADYVIWGAITVLGDVVSIDAQIMDLKEGKRPAQFFQEIKGVSEIIPQLTRFSRKSKRYIEGKEEDFYQEDLSLAGAGPNFAMGRAHPERGYFGYPYYPMRPVKEEPLVEKAKPRFGGIGDPAYEGLTKDVVIDLSGGQPRIGIARDEKENATKAPKEPPPPYYYPPQPYYHYSPPPYYYYQKPAQEEGLFSKMKRALWPFGREERVVPPQPTPLPISPIPPAPQNLPQATTASPSPPQTISPKPQPEVPPQPLPPPQPTPPSFPKSTSEPQWPKESLKPNPWRWE